MNQRHEQLKSLFEKIALFNSQPAFEELFRLEYKRLYLFSLQYVAVHEIAEEVVNDVFIKVWNYRQSLNTVNNPESYLFIAVKNQSLNYLKKYSHLHITLSEDGKIAELVTKNAAVDEVEWKELKHKLAQAIDELPDQCRKIFKLVKEEGFKPKQVAEILNISVRTVETQLYRAVNRLSQVLVKELPVKKKGRDMLPPSVWLIFLLSLLIF